MRIREGRYMDTRIRVGVIGAAGKMGREIMKAVMKDDELELVCAVDVSLLGTDCGELCEMNKCGVEISSDLDETIKEKKPDAMIDFTVAKAVSANAPIVLRNGVNLVIGTSGLSEEELNDFGDLAKANDCGVFIASNFAIGAVLMMKFAAEAIKYMPYAEVIEMHHDHKKDAPSGTAVQTLKKMAENRESFRQGAEDEFEKIEGSRGGEYEGMRVHSVRLPGYVAHQEVMFGGLGQILTIRHDSITRESFIPGIMLAVKKVGDIKGLLSGLENIM